MCRSRRLGEDADQLVVEAALGQPLQSVAEQPEPLDRVDGVHRPLERQVDVELLDQHACLVGDESALLGIELAGEPEEVRQGHHARQPAGVEGG